MLNGQPSCGAVNVGVNFGRSKTRIIGGAKMSGTIYHTCSVCGSEMYPKIGGRSNGDTITEFVMVPCKICASEKEESAPSASTNSAMVSLCLKCKYTFSCIMAGEHVRESCPTNEFAQRHQ